MCIHYIMYMSVLIYRECTCIHIHIHTLTELPAPPLSRPPKHPSSCPPSNTVTSPPRAAALPHYPAHPIVVHRAAGVATAVPAVESAGQVPVVLPDILDLYPPQLGLQVR